MGQKNHTRKISKICKVSELYQIFIHSFLPQNISMPTSHILLRRTKTIFTTSQLYQQMLDLILFSSSSDKEKTQHLVRS